MNANSSVTINDLKKTLHLLTYKKSDEDYENSATLKLHNIGREREQLMDSGVVSIFWEVWINTQWNLFCFQTVHEKNAKILQFLTEFGMYVLMYILYKVKLLPIDFKI